MKKHTQMKKNILTILVVIIFLVLMGIVFWRVPALQKFSRASQGFSRIQRVEIFKNGPSFKKLYIVSTPKERSLGLSRFDHFDDGSAMLFVFDFPAAYSFWMKDMKFPIDILWIDDAGKIVDIKEHADPRDFPKSYVPSTEARYVLELNDGFVERHALALGQKTLVQTVLTAEKK